MNINDNSGGGNYTNGKRTDVNGCRSNNFGNFDNFEDSGLDYGGLTCGSDIYSLNVTDSAETEFYDNDSLEYGDLNYGTDGYSENFNVEDMSDNYYENYSGISDTRFNGSRAASSEIAAPDFDDFEREKERIKEDYYRRKREREEAEQQRKSEIDSTIKSMIKRYENKPDRRDDDWSKVSLKLLIIPGIFLAVLAFIIIASNM